MTIIADGIDVAQAEEAGLGDRAPDPWHGPALERCGEALDPAELLEQLEAGELSASDWRRTCKAAGIAGVDLGQLARPA